MASNDSIRKAIELAEGNEHLKRLIEDQQLRANLFSAYGSARNAFQRASNGKAPTKAIFEDKKLQRDLTDAASALREAVGALKTPPAPKRSGGFGRSVLILLASAVLALALSDSLRSKVLDMLFGAEEEFDYNSTTMPAQDPTEPVAASSS